MTTDGIILYSKEPGPTSFKALNTIKKALNTSKVGHTGTLDSFAQGLLVICTGRLTRLAGNITEFDKSYQAVIKFGEETDTLEYTGRIVNSAPLPDKKALISAIEANTGPIMQQPPLFSAIHLDGHRASDLARSGKISDMPARPVTVFKANLLETKEINNKVAYALIDFSVSKGTYIRSLARDIGKHCGSAAHLIGLYRTKVGSFSIKDAVGIEKNPIFNIDTAINKMNEQLKAQEKSMLLPKTKGTKSKYIPTIEELRLQEMVRQNILPFDEKLSIECGFNNIRLNSENAVIDFKNGKPLLSKNFTMDLHLLPVNSITSVFAPDNSFCGLIEKDENKRIKYKFVIN